ncbi:type VII secretion-associated serine protease mycosin [Nocardia sp. NPDC127526]|uniref:type VII secretion-associated serine protease mycosin n=1 Tax=Nocardia sp. NPDC127526 TaxID=3345393 RepID=UPI00362C906D
MSGKNFRSGVRLAAVMAAVATICGPTAGQAAAAPPDPAEQRTTCAVPVWNGPPLSGPPKPQKALDLSAAWLFSRGAGQKVAVIDTGVTPNPRLPGLIPGGDFVSTSDGTVDCDGHGTLVAGVVAGLPSPADGFSGVAPDARVIAIRQYSLAYQAKNSAGQPPPGQMVPNGYGDVRTLASAVRRAVTLGATVIDIPGFACGASTAALDDESLGEAVKFAFDHNVVVVTAAGDVRSDGACQAQNDADASSVVRTVVSPARFAPYVLPVASVDASGGPSAFSFHGPWVGVAAPGVDIVSLNSAPGGPELANGVPGQQGIAPIDGTAFASGYVAGLAALVRSAFPDLTAGQVIDRIIATAHAPGTGRDNAVGAGMIDPLAALSAELPSAAASGSMDLTRAVAPPPAAPSIDPWPRLLAVAGSGIALLLLVITLVASAPYRSARARPSARDADDVDLLEA